MFDVIIIGGGAAGFFAAAHLEAERILLLEKSAKILSKVAISGGGRCNVTHACFDPSELIENYPRGTKELLGPFHQFGPGDMIAWLEEQGVEVKAEADGRMFPVSDKSSDITGALATAAEKNGVKLSLSSPVESISRSDSGWILSAGGQQIECRFVLVATGGGSKSEHFNLYRKLGHSIHEPVPSLFTFNLEEKNITKLMGVSVNNATVSIEGFDMETTGPLLITHWGFSGPAVLKLSAFAARFLADKSYEFRVKINWLSSGEDEIKEWIAQNRQSQANRLVIKSPIKGIVSRLWEYFCIKSGIPPFLKWAELKKEQERELIKNLSRQIFSCRGKTTYKDEFVTCGGVSLDEIDFRTMESRISPGLFFAGEVLDVDAVTGGFNFQAAWTTAWIAAREINKRLK